MTKVWIVIPNAVPPTVSIAIKDALGVQWTHEPRPTARVAWFEWDGDRAAAKQFVEGRAQELIRQHGIVVGYGPDMPMLPPTP